jgi:hypothetical protein
MRWFEMSYEFSHIYKKMEIISIKFKMNDLKTQSDNQNHNSYSNTVNERDFTKTRVGYIIKIEKDMES